MADGTMISDVETLASQIVEGSTRALGGAHLGRVAASGPKR